MSNSTEQCQHCVNWDTDVKSGLLDFLLPKHYPTDKIPLSGKLSPLKLTYELMKQAIITAHENVVDNTWSLNNAKACLRVHGLNSEAISDILECANNCKYLTMLELTKSENPVECAEISRERDANPELFKMWKFPSVWEHGILLH